MTLVSGPRILLLDASTDYDSYSLDWRDAFQQFPLISCQTINLNDTRNAPGLLKKEIGNCDFVVALHSTNTNANNIRNYMLYVPVLKKRKIPLITFVGNEYNIPFYGTRLGEKIRLFDYLKAEVLCTQLPLSSALKIYAKLSPHTLIKEYPHALNESVFKPQKKQEERKIDLGIKTGRYGNYLGDQDRNKVVDYFKKNAAGFGLNARIENASDSKVGRTAWAEFLNDCKGTIGNESGTYFTEPDDHTVIQIMEYVREKMGIRKQPFWFKRFEEMLYNYHSWIHYPFLHWIYKLFNERLFLMRFAQINLYAGVSDFNFEEIYDKFFKNYPSPVSTRCISSRHFDAIGTKTCQLLLNGSYNSILRPDEHYISISNDFSNIEEAIRKFKDREFRERMVDHTYNYAMTSHLYKHRVERFYTEVLMAGK